MNKPAVYTIVVIMILLAVGLIGYFSFFKSNPLVGSWELSFSDFEAGSLMKSKLGNVDSQQKNQPITVSSDYHIQIDFYSSGNFVTDTMMPMGGGTHPGTWTVTASNDNRPTEIECQYKGEKIRIDIKWVDDDTIEMIPPNFIAFKDSYTGNRTFRRISNQ